MASSHSFDVTLGVPLASVLFPEYVHYIFLNQSVQLVLVNPMLLVLMELGSAGSSSRELSDKDNGRTATIPAEKSAAEVWKKTATAVLTNPLVVFTVAGLAAGQLYPTGMPAPAQGLVKLISGVGDDLHSLAFESHISVIPSQTLLELSKLCTVGRLRHVVSCEC
jgi:hypothetical protein